jgi:UDP-N-acetylmuramate--alanine ligase
MHVYFSGIGGAGIAPLALVAKQAGFEVSGSDKQNTQYIEYLKKHGLSDIHIGQDREHIADVHENHSIDWFVYSSAVSIENPKGPEFSYCHEQGIQVSKRDAFLNYLLSEKNLQLVAVAGTHGKTTTTAMLTWLFLQLHEPISYLLPAKVSYGDMGNYDAKSKYLIYEADEFDRNFLAFEPHLSLITGVAWDHHEIFPTREEYQAAFREFIDQSKRTLLWEEDFDYLQLESPANLLVQKSDNPLIDISSLKGRYNRLDAWLAIQAVHRLTTKPITSLIQIMNDFPGLQRRMEAIVPGLYSDYAHTPEKIRGAMSVALETASEHKQPVVVVYEPLTNRRQHYMIDDYKDCFDGARKLYVIPSYLAREDPDQRIIPPAELISHLSDPTIGEAKEMNDDLKKTIQTHLSAGAMVVCMGGGGGGSLDEWLRQEFQK